jgi:succinate dehydrogenase / fumarate reductase, cytochrome b subunit
MRPMADTAKSVQRPLSPHLQIYRFTWTMAMSILHRITGGALYVGTVLVALWLLAAASGPESFATAQWLAGSWLGLLILFGYTWALLHHMFGGLRHFIWDAGRGFERGSRMALAKYSLVASLVATIALWALVFAMI